MKEETDYKNGFPYIKYKHGGYYIMLPDNSVILGPISNALEHSVAGKSIMQNRADYYSEEEVWNHQFHPVQGKERFCEECEKHIDFHLHK